VRPGSKKISSGNAIEKYLESGSRYRSRMALSLLLVKTNGFAYSRPGTHPAGHSSPSPQSTP